MSRSEYHGKRGANAGDDYHELWAVRRALELIVPGFDVVAVTVEGVSPEDAVGVDDSQWDGVDVACYRGPDPLTIEAIDLVQLKYSGSEPGKAWTVARLASASNKSGTNAVLARLAAAWQAERGKRPDLAVAGKIAVKLVSNQPIGQDVLAALSAPTDNPARARLREATGLSEEDFGAFLLALDFSECGDQSRFAHEERVIVALSALKDGDVRAEYAELREYFRKRMRPEGQRELITAESIFGLFGHADARAFFPHPTKIVAVENLIQREAVGSIGDRFAAGVAKVCLVGAGGEGKTTALQDLAARLPQGSELVVYDCYGEGSYLNANAYRHRSEDAFLQMGNDVAARLLLPPMFAERGVDHPRRFSAKLAAAAEALTARNPAALLVVAVDAADNAVTAARQCIPPEAAFVHDFARLGGLPSNVRLLLSAREGRLPDLSLPVDVDLMRLGPFTPEESRLHAEAGLGPQTTAWHEEFHSHSGGNPRVQRYAIEFAADNSELALDYLKPNGKNLAAIFDARMREARLKSGAPADLEQLCAALVTLPRPVPISHLAAAVSMEAAHARDLVLDLAPGLLINGEGVGFADEDFEHFVRQAGEVAIPRIVEAATERLLSLRATDSYAATHVSSLALLAGRRAEVIALAREPARDYPLSDAGARAEIHRRRLRAAMHACRESGDTVDAAALLLEGAQAIKTDEAVQNTLINNVELATHFSRDAIVALTLRDRGQRPQHGALLLHLASVDGLEGDRVGLNTHFRSFLAWQDARRTAIDAEQARLAAAHQARRAAAAVHDSNGLPAAEVDLNRRDPFDSEMDEGDEPRRWSIDADDVAAMLVGRVHVDGVSALAAMLRRPRPAAFRRVVFMRVVRRLVRRNDLALLAELGDALPRRHPGRAIIELALGITGETFDTETMLARIERASRNGGFARNRMASDYTEEDDESEAVGLLLDACDLVAIHGGDRDRLRAVLHHAMPPATRTLGALTAYAPRASDVAARAFALSRVLEGKPARFEDFVHQPPAEEIDKGAEANRKKVGKGGRKSRRAQPVPVDSSRDREKAKDVFEHILAVQETRARILVGDITPLEAPDQLASAVAKMRGARRYQAHRLDVTARDDAVIRALLVLGAIPGVDGPAVFAVIGDALGPVEAMMRFGVIALLERASVAPGFRPSIIQLAVTSCEHVRGLKMPAEEKIEFIIGLATLLLSLDREASNYCFDAAISVAGEVDYDTLHAIAISAPLARSAKSAGDSEIHCRLAVRLAAIVQDAAQRIGDSSRFSWRSIAEALATLSPSVALAAAGRFAELDLARSPELLAKVLEQFAQDESLSDTILAGFIPVLGASATALRDKLLSRPSPDSAIVEEISRYLLLEQPEDVELAAGVADRLSTTGEWTGALAETAQFIKARPSDPATGQSDQYFSASPPLAEVVDPALLDPAGIDGVSSFIARIDAIGVAEATPYPLRRRAADQILARVPIHRTHTFLEIIAAIPEGDDVIYDLARMFLEQFDRWSGRGGASRWARERLLDVIAARLPEFAWGIDYRIGDLEKLLGLTAASHAEIAMRLLAAIEKHIDDLSSHVVIRLVGLLARYLAPEEALGVLDRHTAAMLARLEPGDRATPGFDALDSPEATAGRYLYAELGHIDHQHRWRAAHGLRTLARLGRSDILELVRARYEDVTEPALNHPEAPFYFMAARLWFMFAISRIAWETPALVAPMRTWLFRQAERTDFPHLLIQATARHALEGLMTADPAAFDADAEKRIKAITASPLRPKKSSQQSRKAEFDRYRPLSEEGRRFRFDSLDTLPYWYSPLLRCFAAPDPAVFLDRAEGWIVDRLGVSGDVWEYDKLRGNSRFNRYGIEGSGHGHGAIPSLERYRTHLEWNAMFLAGGELLREWPLPPPNKEDNWNHLSSWLARQGPTLAPIWLADLRGPKPLTAEAWWKPDKERWLRRPLTEDIRRGLGLDTEDWIDLSTSLHTRHGELVGSMRSESCLVSRRNATALRLALEASENSHQYRLAVNDDTQEISSGQFVLKSVLVDRHGDMALDKHDPLRGSVAETGQRPHPRIVALLGLRRDAAGLPVWRDPDGDVVIEANAWSDPSLPERGQPRDASEGERIRIRRTALKQILEAEGLDLIINLTFSRRIGESNYGRKKDKTREREFDYLVVLRHDGSIDAGTRGLGRWS